MRTQLLDNLNIKKSDLVRFFPLFLHSFFINNFITFYFLPANSLFIFHYGSAYLPYAYIAAGLTGYVTTLIYSWFQKRVRSKNLFKGAIIFMMIIPIVFWVIHRFYPIVSERTLAFIVFMFAWPFISLVNTESGGVTLGLFNIRQVKKLFGLANIGGIISSIIFNFTIPLFIPFLNHTYDLLLFSLLGTIPTFIILIYIFRKFPDMSTAKDKDLVQTTEDEPSKFKDLIKEKYFVLIFLSATLSMIMLYFTDFGYLSSIKVQPFLQTKEKISSFIALVIGFFKIGELIISYFSSRLLSRYGVKFGLALLPFASTIFIFFATIFGFTFGVTSIAFFVMIVLNKCSERICRRGLDDPSFNILYQPLSGKFKFAVQTQVGVVHQFTITIAGALLLGITSILNTKEGFQLKYYMLFFLPFLIAWSYISIQLFLEYRKRLRQILADKSKDKKKEDSKYDYGDEILKRKLKKLNSGVVGMSVTILSETNPKLLEPYAANLIELENDTIKKGILKNIDPTWRKKIQSTAQKIAEKSPGTEIGQIANFASSYFDIDNTEELTDDKINELLNSDKKDDKILIIKSLLKKKRDNDEEIISKLLDSNIRIVTLSAIDLIPKRNSAALNHKLVKLVESEEFAHPAANIILDIGDKLLPEIEKVFSQKKSPKILIRFIEVCAKMGSTLAKSILLKQINYPNRDVQQAAIRGLNFCRFQASATEYHIIKQKLEETIENVLWIYACLNDLEDQTNTLKLIQSLDIDKESSLEQVFFLLSFLYDPKVINLIKKNIIGENTIFALEIIDNFIPQEIKQLIMPLFDDISKNQKLKKLQRFFPQHKLGFAPRLQNIIVRDYDRIDPWTIAKAVELLGKQHKKKKGLSEDESDTEESEKIELWTTNNVKKLLSSIRKSEMPDEIFAGLWHPEEIVFTTSAQIIYEENPSRCISYLQGLSTKKQELIDILNGGRDTENQLITKKIRYLKKLSVFFSIPDNLLVKIASILTIQELEKDSTLELKNEVNGDNEKVYFVVAGKLAYKKGTEREKIFTTDDIIIRGLNTSDDDNNLEITRNAILLVGFRYEYFNLLADETGIIHYMFEIIQSRK